MCARRSISAVNTLKYCDPLERTRALGVTLQWKNSQFKGRNSFLLRILRREANKKHLFASRHSLSVQLSPFLSRSEPERCLLAAPLIGNYLPGGSGQIVGVQHVEVVPGAQQETTSLLVQQQRVGVEAVGGTQEQGDAASLQQLCRTEITRLLRRLRA